MKFSVLMSLYRREQPEFLRQCLNSLAAQTRLADEIVLVFDGAVGSELEAVVQDFQAALPLNIVRLPENVGLGLALNAGLRHCTHEWVMRMDSDDIALPERFALQCAYLAAQPHTVLLGGQIREFSADAETETAVRQVPQTLEAIRRFAQRRNPFNHMTVAYTRTAVQQAGGYIHHAGMEDYNLWLRMLAGGAQAANLPDVLVQARTGAGMLQRRRGLAYVHSEWQLYRLKRQLSIQAALPALFYLVLRSLPRLLPAALLRLIYRITRSS